MLSITSQKDFALMRKSETVFHCKYFVAVFHNLEKTDSKFAIITAKKHFKTSVERHRIKRRIKEALRLEIKNNLQLSKQQIMCLIIAKKQAQNASWSDVESSVNKAVNYIIQHNNTYDEKNHSIAY